MREINLKEEFEKNDFEEISEECLFEIEGGCGGGGGGFMVWNGSPFSTESVMRGYT